MKLKVCFENFMALWWSPVLIVGVLSVIAFVLQARALA